MEKAFLNRNVLITGGSGYIGKAIAYRFASEGANVAVCGLTLNKIMDVVNSIKNQDGKAIPYILDVTDENCIREVFNDFISNYGELHILVNCAGGGSRGEASYLKEQKAEIIDRILNVNLRGTIYCTREALSYMGRGGRIINIASTLAFQGRQRYSEYAAAKGGVISFTKSMAKEVGNEGITVNCVSPGHIAREDELFNMKDNLQQLRDISYINEIGSGEDCANAVRFLASDEAGFVTGANIMVDGGWGLALKSTPEGVLQKPMRIPDDIQPNLRYIVYGTGDNGKKALELIQKNDAEVVFYCDSDKQKWNTFINDKKVIGPRQLEEYRACFDKIAIGSNKVWEIKLILKSMGMDDEDIICPL